MVTLNIYFALLDHTDDAVSADIKLETEGDDASDDCPSNLPPNAYHPRVSGIFVSRRNYYLIHF